tara:strand:- start:146 stop:547 length:402 start_codon:yes stop_codon:yes gene_type:complete
MDKDKIQNMAEQIADDMGYDYFDMTPRLQAVVYKMAMDDFSDGMADMADSMRKNEAGGGMMRANYAMGSEDQASGIMSLEETKMQSAPSIKMASDDRDDFVMDEYKKYVFESLEQGIEPVSFKQFLDQILAEG